MEKYENEQGKIGVLISDGYGSGWSTWEDHNEFLSMDRTLIEMKLNNTAEEEVKAYCEKKIGTVPYMGGWDNAYVEWLDKGTRFMINEYDGNESILLLSDLNMTA